jgi:hypothetical protein
LIRLERSLTRHRTFFFLGVAAPCAASVLLVAALGFEKADAQGFAIRVRRGDLENTVVVGILGSLHRLKLT